MATVSTTDITNPLVRIGVKDFMKANAFTQVHNEVRQNSNGYPFVTFINGKNEAENIYFSKGASALPSAKLGTPIAKGYFDAFSIAETTNTAGEKRIKLVRQGDSSRKEMDDLF